jgi:hypothetical protein
MGSTTASRSGAVRAAATLGTLGVDRTALVRLLALPVFAAWIWWDASVSPSRLGSLGAVLVGLLAVGLVTQADELGPLDTPRRILAGGLVAFTAWSFLSVVWADFPAAAWAGANRTLVYAAAFSLFFLWPWRDRDLVLTAGLVGAVVALSAAAAVIRLLAAPSAAELLDEGRLAYPTGYANGNAALWTMGALLTIPLAAARELAPWARSLLLAGSTILVGLGVLAQSRGWLVGLPVAAILLLACGRDRLRLLLALGIVAVAAAAVARPLDEVFTRFADDRPLGPALERGLWLLLAAAAAVAAAGWGWAWLDGRVETAARTRRLVTVAVSAALVLALVGAVVVGVRAVGNPATWVSEKWDEFAAGASGETDGSRLSGSLASDRYQEWRIAAAAFADHPLVGIGADNYAAEYLLRRDDTSSQPVHPHSTPLRILSQLGVVGAVLFAVVAVVAVVLAVRRRAAATGLTATAIGAALSAFAFWLVAGSFDVLWEIPALAAPAFALAGLAAAPVAAPDEAGERPSVSRKLVWGAVAALAIALVSLVVTWASFSFMQDGREIGAADPARAYARLDTAASLNPLTALPFVYKGLIAREAGEPDVARAAFERALEREADNWFAAMELGLLEASEGNGEAALEALRRAQALNPLDPLLAIAIRLVSAGEPVDPALFDQLYFDGLNRESVDWLVERYFQVPPFTVPGSSTTVSP